MTRRDDTPVLLVVALMIGSGFIGFLVGLPVKGPKPPTHQPESLTMQATGDLKIETLGQDDRWVVYRITIKGKEAYFARDHFSGGYAVALDPK